MSPAPPKTALEAGPVRAERWGAVIERYVLPNGLKVILWEDHRVPILSYQTWFGVGSRHEAPGPTGIAHLFEHMMFKATANHGEGEFDRIMERHGAHTNAATWADWTHYKNKLPADQLDLVIQLESDRMEHLVLDERQLESEREVVINERLLRVDNDPEGRLYEELYGLAFGKDHPYGWPTIGWMEDIKSISLEDCLRFYARNYAPDNATIVVVGDVQTDEVVQKIEAHYGHLEAQGRPEEIWPPEVVPTSERHSVLQLPLSLERRLMAWRGVGSLDPRLPALEVLDEILTGGISSRLYRALVTERELCSDVGGWTSSWAHPGLYEMSLSMMPGKTGDQAQEVLDQILRDVRSEGVTAQELAKAQNCIEADHLRALGGVGRRAYGLGEAEVTDGDFRQAFHHMDALGKVEVDEVHGVACELLGESSRTVVCGMPA